MKITFNSEGDLLLNMTLELHNMIMIVGAVFYEKKIFTLRFS